MSNKREISLSEQDVTKFQSRLRQLMHGLSEAKFAEKVGISQSGLHRILNGGLPTMDVLIAIAIKTDSSVEWLATGLGSQRRVANDAVVDPMSGSGSFLEHTQNGPSRTERLPDALKAADFVNLPQYDVRASAGRGLIAINEMPVSETAFERNFLRNLGGVPEYCFMMWSAGDSMYPTIPDNSLMIVDSSQTIVDHGCIYVFTVGNAVLVKRAKWRMDGRLELTSDNVAGNYPIETFDADRVEDLTVVGRVIFIGHAP